MGEVVILLLSYVQDCLLDFPMNHVSDFCHLSPIMFELFGDVMSHPYDILADSKFCMDRTTAIWLILEVSQAEIANLSI